MKKIIYTFLILLILVLTSCSSYDNNSDTDGIPFVYYESFVYENISYDIYEVENIYLIDNENIENQVIKYEYQEIDKDSTDEWIINYLQDYEYHMDQIKVKKDVVNKMYEVIYDSIIKFEEILMIDLEYYPANRLIEREFVVDSSKEYTSILLIDILIPYRLVNTSNNQTNIVYIPVKTSLAYRNNDVLEMVFDDLVININYSYFISLSKTE